MSPIDPKTKPAVPSSISRVVKSAVEAAVSLFRQPSPSVARSNTLFSNSAIPQAPEAPHPKTNPLLQVKPTIAANLESPKINSFLKILLQDGEFPSLVKILEDTSLNMTEKGKQVAVLFRKLSDALEATGKLIKKPEGSAPSFFTEPVKDFRRFAEILEKTPEAVDAFSDVNGKKALRGITDFLSDLAKEEGIAGQAVKGVKNFDSAFDYSLYKVFATNQYVFNLRWNIEHWTAKLNLRTLELFNWKPTSGLKTGEKVLEEIGRLRNLAWDCLGDFGEHFGRLEHLPGGEGKVLHNELRDFLKFFDSLHFSLKQGGLSSGKLVKLYNGMLPFFSEAAGFIQELHKESLQFLLGFRDTDKPIYEYNQLIDRFEFFAQALRTKFDSKFGPLKNFFYEFRMNVHWNMVFSHFPEWKQTLASGLTEGGTEAVKILDRIAEFGKEGIKLGKRGIEVAGHGIEFVKKAGPALGKVFRVLGPIGVGLDSFFTFRDPFSSSVEKEMSVAAVGIELGALAVPALVPVGIGVAIWKDVETEDRIRDQLYMGMMTESFTFIKALATQSSWALDDDGIVKFMERMTESNVGKDILKDKRYWDSPEMKQAMEKFIGKLLDDDLMWDYIGDDNMAHALYFAARHSPEMLQKVINGGFNGRKPDPSDWQELSEFIEKAGINPKELLGEEGVKTMNEIVAENRTITGKLKGWIVG